MRRDELCNVVETKGYPRYFMETVQSVCRSTTIVTDKEYWQRTDPDSKNNKGVKQESVTLFSVYINCLITRMKFVILV